MLQFDPETGFSISEISDTREQVAQEWKNAFKADNTPELNTEPETPAGQLIDSQTDAITQKDAEIAYLANQFNPVTASGIWQDALAKIYFITRHAAIPSTAVIECRGLEGTVITAGSQIRSSVDATIWQCTETGTIPAEGVIELPFACVREGAVTAAPNTLTRIVTGIAGWDSVTNPAAAVTGQTQETQGAFEQRRYLSVAQNSRSSAASVYGRVANLEGVLTVCVRQNRLSTPYVIDGVTLSPHSIYVSVIGGQDEAIAEALYNAVSAGCDYNGNTEVEITDPYTGALETVKFDRPEDLNIGVKVEVMKTDTLPADAVTLIQDAVYKNFYGESGEYVQGQPLLRVALGDDLYASRFYVSVQNAGIDEILSIQVCSGFTSAGGVNTWGSYVHIPINKNPVLLTSSIVVNVVDVTEDAAGADEAVAGTAKEG